MFFTQSILKFVVESMHHVMTSLKFSAPCSHIWYRNSLIYSTYSFDCQHKASVCEEDCGDRETEVAAEHVHHKWFIVEARSQSVIVRSTRNLKTLRNVPLKIPRHTVLDIYALSLLLYLSTLDEKLKGS